MFVLDKNNSQAEEIARDFLSQSYSIIRIEKSELIEQACIVDKMRRY